MNTTDNPGAAAVRPRVLIADNDPGVSALLAEVLAGEGLDTAVVADGFQVLRRLQETVVDLLVCDLDMPGMDGLEVLRHLRRESAPPPVLVITGYLNQDSQGFLDELPFVRQVFEKPFDLFTFSRLARELLAGRAAPGTGSEAGAEGGVR